MSHCISEKLIITKNTKQLLFHVYISLFLGNQIMQWLSTDLFYS